VARTDQPDRTRTRGRRPRRNDQPTLPFPYNHIAWTAKAATKAIAALAVLIGVAGIRLTWRAIRLTVLGTLALAAASKIINGARDELIEIAVKNGGNTRKDAKFDIDGAWSMPCSDRICCAATSAFSILGR
jgi:oxepin-CoA hydrolase/3-oxo-5,6-dehydrosuberyl-CoA semialdehyde dehydrogenase